MQHAPDSGVFITTSRADRCGRSCRASGHTASFLFFSGSFSFSCAWQLQLNLYLVPKFAMRSALVVAVRTTLANQSWPACRVQRTRSARFATCCRSHRKCTSTHRWSPCSATSHDGYRIVLPVRRYSCDFSMPDDPGCGHPIARYCDCRDVCTVHREACRVRRMLLAL
jgi:hypothetical protein